MPITDTAAQRYLIFAGNLYGVNNGGWADFICHYPTLEEAEKSALLLDSDWWHIVDLNVCEVVSKGIKGVRLRN